MTVKDPAFRWRRSRIHDGEYLTHKLTSLLTTLFSQKNKLEFPQRVPKFTRGTHCKIFKMFLSQNMAQNLQISHKSHIY